MPEEDHRASTLRKDEQTLWRSANSRGRWFLTGSQTCSRQGSGSAGMVFWAVQSSALQKMPTLALWSNAARGYVPAFSLLLFIETRASLYVYVYKKVYIADTAGGSAHAGTFG